MDFKNIDKKYRPVPFWSWNEKLEVGETLRQIGLMDDVGIGGFFMHARGGLQTEYMGEEWFENVGASVEDAAKRGMHAWAYDENGWPSGFGGGKVNGKGEKFQQKYLRVEKFTPDLEDPRTPHTICCFEHYHFYYEVNPFYVDTLDGEVIADFINEIYEPYYAKYGSSFDGFFTDEPQISRNGIPWSLKLPEEYERAYGEKIYDHLIELFAEVGDYQTTRVRFWKLVTELFSKNYMKQIYDWCTAHDLKFTGHLVLEETLLTQLITNGACMPHYEYLHIPGMDWLGRPIFPCLTQMQVASVAAQMGKKQVLSETFALCGHNVGHDELKRNYEWMMVRGINLLCQHLEGYSNRGIRKRDYPPAMYCQQPWWADYKVFNDAVSRVGMLLAEGEISFDTLLIHPQTTAWICYNNGESGNEKIKEYHKSLIDTMVALEKKHILYHLGDEIMMERHAHVEGNALVIGTQRYTKIVIPEHIAFLENTEKLLAEFRAGGGQIVTADELAENDIIDIPEITYTKRNFKDFTMHYFVNSTGESYTAKIKSRGFALDLATGEELPFDGTYTFPPMGSLVVIDDGKDHSAGVRRLPANTLPLDGEWQVVGMTDNALTLDKCTYWFDGVLQEENGYILNVASRAYALEKPVDIRCRFEFCAEYLPEKLYLACETPEIFKITVNGREIDKTGCGFFRDKSFVQLDISKYVTLGVNVIETEVHFKQSEEVYENMRKSKIFESEKNKLTYDMEIEAMYLVGQFGVRTDGVSEDIPNDAIFFDGSFVITQPPKTLAKPKHLERQGFPFFAGELTIAKNFTVTAEELKAGVCLSLKKRGYNAARVKVNGKAAGTLLWTPFAMDITAFLHTGENTVELTLVNNLRNLLGPLHNAAGELHIVGPHSFFYQPSIWNGYHEGGYTPKYCFVKFGFC